MARKSAKQVATSYFEAVASRDLEAMEAHYAPGGRGYLYGMAELTVPGTYREYFSSLFAAFPDFTIAVTDMTAYGDKAAVRWRATGTFSGSQRFQGLAPTGARIELEGLDLLTIADGLIVTNHAYTNEAELARQLGAMPASGSAGEKFLLGAVNALTAARKSLERLAERRR